MNWEMMKQGDWVNLDAVQYIWVHETEVRIARDANSAWIWKDGFSSQQEAQDWLNAKMVYLQSTRK